MSAIVVRRVETVDCVANTPEEMFNSTGRIRFVKAEVGVAMPRGEDEGDKVIFFQPDPWEYDHSDRISDEALERAYEKRNLVPLSPYRLGEVNKADPAFADEHPNRTQWKDAQGKWCYIAFHDWCGERYVRAYYSEGGAYDSKWWFAGVPRK